MARKRLTAKQVEGKLKPGYHGDGDGLWLAVGKTGSRSWVFKYVSPTALPGANGRKPVTGMGLGAAPLVTLAEARDKALELRRQVAAGIDPLEERKREKAQAATDAHRLTTFAEAATAYIDAKEGGFKNEKHKQQWRNTIEAYANPIFGKSNVADINTDLVLKVLQQDVRDKAGEIVGTLWNTKTETASRLRGRIEAVLSWAAFRGLRPQGDNPARWKGHLETELTARTKLQKTQHRPALPYAEIGEFMAQLRSRDGVAQRALEFCILTAVRPGNVPAATWDEIDFNAKVWSIDGSKMKAGKDHQVPLCDEAIALLKSLPREDRKSLVFIGAAKNGGLSENALNNVAKAVSGKEITAHGFRSSFRDWAGETTAHPREVIEHALAHSLKDKAEAAYQRGTLMPKRRKLMEDWSKFCGTVQPKDAENVVPIRSGAV